MLARDSIKPKKKKRNHFEYDLQCAIIEVCKKEYPEILLFSVPLEACSNRFPHFEKSGALRGTSDLIFFSKKGVCFIELKTETGRLRTEQKHFGEKVNALGYEYIVVRSVDAFRDVANRYS